MGMSSTEKPIYASLLRIGLLGNIGLISLKEKNDEAVSERCLAIDLNAIHQSQQSYQGDITGVVSESIDNGC